MENFFCYGNLDFVLKGIVVGYFWSIFVDIWRKCLYVIELSIFENKKGWKEKFF